MSVDEMKQILHLAERLISSVEAPFTYLELQDETVGGLPVIGMTTRRYKGTVILTQTEIDKIEKMDVRSDDIWVISFAKSGTTLVQEIVYLISTDVDFKSARERELDDRFPFLDIHVPITPYYRGVRYIEKLPSPRFIKTHLQYHILPPSLHKAKPKIVYVARNPKDVFVSFYHFLKYFGELGDITLRQFCQECINDRLFGSPWWKHVLQFWNHRNDENILFLKYEDIIKDLPGTVRHIAAFLGKEVTSSNVDKIAEHCSFGKMKNNDMVNLKYMKAYCTAQPTNGHLLRNGKSGGWRDYDIPEMDVLDDIIREKLVPAGLSF